MNNQNDIAKLVRNSFDNLVYLFVRNPSDLQANETENQRPCGLPAKTRLEQVSPQKPTAPDLMMQSAEEVPSRVCHVIVREILMLTVFFS